MLYPRRFRIASCLIIFITLLWISPNPIKAAGEDCCSSSECTPSNDGSCSELAQGTGLPYISHSSCEGAIAPCPPTTFGGTGKLGACTDTCVLAATPPPSGCSGPTNGPCSGSCPGGGSCRPATAGNGGACGCHSSGAGGVCSTEKDCRKSVAAGGSGCSGSGLSGASGCSGCNSNQVCCQRQTCCYPSDPTAPTLNLPINGSSSTNTTVTLSWNQPSDWGDDCLENNNKHFNVYWGFTSSTPYELATTPYPAPATKTSNAFIGQAGKTYYWKVVATNGTKTKSSPVRSFKINDNTVSGIVYYDAANSCSLATSVPWNKGGGLTAQLTNPSVCTANIPSGGVSAGQFSIIAPNGTYGSLRLLGLPNTYKCSTSCSQACPTKTGIVSPSTNNRFFITDQILSSEGWWQVVGGPVYAGSRDGGTTIRSELPLATSKLILPGAGGSTDGALVRASGNTDLGDGTVSTSGWSTKGTYSGKITDYGYFAAALGVIQGQDSGLV